MNPEDLILKFEIPLEPVFNNDMYWGVPKRTASGRMRAVTARTGNLKVYQGQMKELLEQILPLERTERFKYLFDTKQFDIEVIYVHRFFYKRFYDMDATNLTKAQEDCIVSHLKIDDCYTSKFISQKVPTEVDNGWICEVTMTLVPRHPLLHGR